MEETKLMWVVWQGRATSVEHFAGRQWRRPEVFCPECDAPMLIRMWKQEPLYAEHLAESACPLSQPEFVRHHNLKMELRGRLSAASRLYARVPCSGGKLAEGCQGAGVQEIFADWTRVEVGRTAQGEWPDVVLIDKDRPIGGFDIRVLPMVMMSKPVVRAGWELPWLAVEGTEDLLRKWTTDTPLPVVARSQAAHFLCEACKGGGRAEGVTEAKHQATPVSFQKVQVCAPESVPIAEDREKEDRRLFAASARAMEKRLRQNGTVIRRIRVFDRLLAGGQVQRDALVIGDVYRGGSRLGAFLGVLGDFSVLRKSQATPRDDDEASEKQGEDYLLQLRKEEGVVDVPAGWFNLENTVRNGKFFNGWTWEGKDHRWPKEPAPPSPWRVPWAEEGVDHLDLLRFFFVRYLSGLPVRYRWSEKKGSWFLPRVEEEEPWRIWPEG